MSARIVSIACLATLAGVARAQAPAAFDVRTIDVAGRAVAAEIADLDGDGRAELLSVVFRGAPPAETREIEIRRLGEDGHVEAKPSWSAALPGNAAGYDVADLDGRPGAELLLLERDGVAVLLNAGPASAWRRLRVPAPPTIAVGPDERGLDRVRLARPELGAGRVVVPGFGEAWVLGPRGEIAARLEVGGRANYLVPRRPGPTIGESELELYFDVPTLQTADVDGDGRADIAASTRHELRLFLQREDGSFPGAPDRAIALGLIPLDDHVRNTGSVRLELANLDRDGRADLVVSHVSGGLLRASNRTRIYRNRGGAFDLARADLEIERSGGVAADEILDLDGDGRPEWLRIFLPLGPLALAELFLQRSVDVEVALHRPEPERLFESKPWLERSLSFPFDFETLRPRGFAPTLRADWNRDGYLDLASSAGGDAVEIWLGGPAHRYERPNSRDAIDSGGRIAIGDLDGDGLPDFVLFDPRRSGVPLRVGIQRGSLAGTAPRLDAATH